MRKTRMPTRATRASISNSSARGAGHSGILFLHNLVNALTAQVKLVGNLAKCAALATKRKNLFVSVDVGGGPRAERSPLPTREGFQLCDARTREETLLLALAHIAHPSPDVYFLPFYDFNMNRRDSAVPLTSSELLEGSGVLFKAGVVVHSGADYNSGIRSAGKVGEKDYDIS